MLRTPTFNDGYRLSRQHHRHKNGGDVAAQKVQTLLLVVVVCPPHGLFGRPFKFFSHPTSKPSPRNTLLLYRRRPHKQKTPSTRENEDFAVAVGGISHSLGVCRWCVSVKVEKYFYSTKQPQLRPHRGLTVVRGSGRILHYSV